MPEGGVLKIIARQLKGGVELLFQDQGKGIPEEKQSNIFEPFFSTKDGGTGLGLTVSYNIITAHGGTLEYLSERVPGAVGVDAIELLACLDDLARLDFDVGGLALGATAGLVDHDA